MLYDEGYHLHLGYYENGYDLEAVAFKRKADDIWDVFFNFEQYGLRPIGQENDMSSEEFGTKFFPYKAKTLIMIMAQKSLSGGYLLTK